MRRTLLLSAAMLGVTAGSSSLSAQTCSNPAQIGDACAVASDLFRYIGTQMGTAIAGGSHTLGIGTNLGGFPHFAVAARANAVKGSVPTINDVFGGVALQRNFAVSDAPVPMLTADFALGLTKGFNLGVTRVGGIDLIGGVTYVPTIDENDVSIVPQDNIAVGLGARIGILQQTALIPGVAVSYMKRDLPSINVGASADDGSTFDLTDLSVKTSSWRVSAQKNLFLLQLAAGYGSDTYDLGTTAQVVVAGEGSGSVSDKLNVTRTTMYGSVGLNLFLFKIIGEVGQVSGGTVPTFNSFDTAADASRLYGTLGVRISF